MPIGLAFSTTPLTNVTASASSVAAVLIRVLIVLLDASADGIGPTAPNAPTAAVPTAALLRRFRRVSAGIVVSASTFSTDWTSSASNRLSSLIPGHLSLPSRRLKKVFGPDECRHL